MELSILYFIPLLALLAVIALTDFKNGMFLVLATVPLYLARVKIFGIPSTWLELAIYTLVGVFVLTRVVRGVANGRVGDARERPLRMYFLKMRPLLMCFIALFFIGAFMSALIAPDKRAAFGMLKGWFFDPLLFFLLFITVMKNKSDIFRAIFSLSLGAFALSLYGFWEFANKKFMTDSTRLDSLFESPNYFTMYAVPVLILSFGALGYIFFARINRFVEAFRGTPLLDLPLYVLFTIAVFAGTGFTALYLTASYGGWAAFVAGVFLLCIFLPRSKAKYALCALGIAVFAPIFFLTYERTGFVHRDLFWKEKTDSVSARVIIWRGAAHLLKGHPLAGIGLGGFRVRYKEYSDALPTPPIERSVILPHNLYLNLWLETGFLGLIGFLGMVAVSIFESLKNFLKTKNYLIILPLAALIAILVHGIVDTPYFKNDLSLLFWIVLGMMVVLENERVLFKPMNTSTRMLLAESGMKG